MLVAFAHYLLFGCLAGVLSGMLGIGGGVVIVPFLLWRLEREGCPAEFTMLVAVATSLASIVITSLSAVYAHHRRGAVRWAWVRRLTPGILVGTAVGAMVAERLPNEGLKGLFALFLLFVAWRMSRRVKAEGAPVWRPDATMQIVTSLLIGLMSALVGIGGGTLSVPFLTRCGHPMRDAVAISGALGFFIALSGALGYIVLGWHHAGLPPLSLGYVYLPAFLGIVLTSSSCAPLGAHLAYHLPASQLRRLFALVLLFIGGRLLWQVLARLH